MTSPEPQIIPCSIPSKFRFLSEPMRYKGAYGGRGSAKSRSFARELLIQGSQRSLKILCTREFQKSTKESVKALLENDIERLNIGSEFQVLGNEIRGYNGTQFLFAGLRHHPQAIKSMEGIDIAWMEEANTASQTSLDFLIPTVREENSEIWFTYNPHLITDPIHNMFVVNKRPDSYIQQVNYMDNPFFPEVLRKEMEWCKEHDFEKYLHVWMGEIVKLAKSIVFSGRWRTANFEAPEGTVFYYGADWGFANDPTILVRMFVDNYKRIIYVDYEAYGIGVEIDDTPDLFDKVPASRKWKITADSARPETISYMNRHGFKCKGAKKGAGSVLEGVEFLKSYDIVVHQRCKHVIDELKTYSWKVDPLTNEILPILVDKKNHIIDGMRYALENVRKSSKVLT